VLRWVYRCVGRDRFPAWPARLEPPPCLGQFEFRSGVTLALEDVGAEPLRPLETLDDSEVQNLRSGWDLLSSIGWLFGGYARSTARLGPAMEQIFAFGAGDQTTGHLQLLEQPVEGGGEIASFVQAQQFGVVHRAGQSGWSRIRVKAAYDRRGRLAWYHSLIGWENSGEGVSLTAYATDDQLKVEVGGGGERFREAYSWDDEGIIVDPTLVGLPPCVQRRLSAGERFSALVLDTNGNLLRPVTVMFSSQPDSGGRLVFELPFGDERQQLVWVRDGAVDSFCGLDRTPASPDILHERITQASDVGPGQVGEIRLQWPAGPEASGGDGLDLALCFPSSEACAAHVSFLDGVTGQQGSTLMVHATRWAQVYVVPSIVIRGILDSVDEKEVSRRGRFFMPKRPFARLRPIPDIAFLPSLELGELGCDSESGRPSAGAVNELARLATGIRHLDLCNLLLHERVLHSSAARLPEAVRGDTQLMAGYRLGVQLGILGHAACLSRAIELLRIDEIRRNVFGSGFFQRLSGNLRQAGLTSVVDQASASQPGLFPDTVSHLLALQTNLCQAVLPPS